ncbi:hypothetical protein UO65_5942 [Actinokineospora spheciospongiae]|uniref:Fido domain-containing protein n=1 Tax=Actinokineospora spheciospongiae TaxID=909613 RepID=W7ID39_9PSEU|nr:Fic family protein [Actinokineospora spheciospongiae]EWC58765.1 hypothetical protein UO65_5942 [Actinokineospora spheciospongiae]
MTDHLAVWLTTRQAVPWHEVPDPGPGPLIPVRDGPLHDIDTHDHARSPRRAAGLRTALTLLRADASAGRDLSMDLLAGWQRHVLAEPAPLRTGPAFAKNGHERYDWHVDLRDRLDVFLAEAADGPPLPARAARAYLDVCFHHPFADGNARAAFLALTFILARAGITLDHVGPIRRVARFADDPTGALAFAQLIATLITAARSRTPAR